MRKKKRQRFNRQPSPSTAASTSETKQTLPTDIIILSLAVSVAIPFCIIQGSAEISGVNSGAMMVGVAAVKRTPPRNNDRAGAAAAFNINTPDIEMHISDDGAVELADSPVKLNIRMEEEAYPEEEQRQPAKCRGYKAYILIACIAVLVIIAAVVVTSMSRDSAEDAEESSPSSSTGTTTVEKGVDAAVPLTSAPSSSSSFELPSSHPSASPTTTPSITPTDSPSTAPSTDPTSSSIPSAAPTYTSIPSESPTTSSAPSTSTTPSDSTMPSNSPTNSTMPSEIPSTSPTKTAMPSDLPTIAPTFTSEPSNQPTLRPTPRPTPVPTPQQIKGCITHSVYDQIDRDIEQLKNGITNVKKKAHFLGGIVRLVAHDFMDYDDSEDDVYGPDGCFDPDHPANEGLPDIWCRNGCALTDLYEDKYSHISKADFWIASANAVIRQTSVDNALDLRDTFEWGRKDANSCSGSGSRVPSPRSCEQTEKTFLDRMGLSWAEATALMGAHTLGRGDEDFSGFHGTWVSSNNEAMVFDNAYFEEALKNSWRPTRIGSAKEQWTTGDGEDRVMLNTDLCLVMDIDENIPCCAGSSCTGSGAGMKECPLLPANHPRSEAMEAFLEYRAEGTNNQAPFYDAFRESWGKATRVGQNNLYPLADSCDLK